MGKEDDIQHQLAEYTQFVDRTLKPQLVVATADADMVRSEIADYEDLRNRLDSLLLPPVAVNPSSGNGTYDEKQPQHKGSGPIESMVDLGYGTIYCRAVTISTQPTPDIFVNVGMGFHVEMTVQDAKVFVSKRISFLKDNKLKEKETKERDIINHIEAATIILNQLQAELQGTR